MRVNRHQRGRAPRRFKRKAEIRSGNDRKAVSQADRCRTCPAHGDQRTSPTADRRRVWSAQVAATVRPPALEPVCPPARRRCNATGKCWRLSRPALPSPRSRLASEKLSLSRSKRVQRCSAPDRRARSRRTGRTTNPAASFPRYASGCGACDESARRDPMILPRAARSYKRRGPRARPLPCLSSAAYRPSRRPSALPTSWVAVAAGLALAAGFAAAVVTPATCPSAI